MDIDSITPQDMRFNPPSFDAAEIAKNIASEYSLEGMWEPLVGERDQNFRLTVEDGQNYVVKIAGRDEDPDVTDFQVQALLYLEQGSPQLPVPRIVRTHTGGRLSKISGDYGVTHAVRVARIRIQM